MFWSSSRDKFMLLQQNSVTNFSVGFWHGVSIQISVNLGKKFLHLSCLRTFAPIATAYLQCACYSLGMHMLRHFQACNKPKTQQNIELMIFALTWCANIFVGCSVTPTFFRQITSFSDSFHYTKKNKKICTWEALIISHLLFTQGGIGT